MCILFNYNDAGMWGGVEGCYSLELSEMYVCLDLLGKSVVWTKNRDPLGSGPY
jgi:hypothetical protein